MNSDKSLTGIGELSEVGKTLIEKVSDAMGGWFKPFQIIRVAKAKAEAELIKAQSRIKISELKQRALSRFMSEESRKQENIESITSKAIPLLSESALPQDIDDDWITNFFDKCRIISDDEMQTIWANILAEEANSPGSFSKRTVNSLNSIDKNDALLFTKFCSFCWKDSEGDNMPFIIKSSDTIYSDSGLLYSHVLHLDSIGLIDHNSFSGFITSPKLNVLQLSYFGKKINLDLTNLSDGFSVGHVIFTQVGEELAKICQPVQVEDFYGYSISKWLKQGVILSSPLDIIK